MHLLGINEALITQHKIPISIKKIPTITAFVFGRYLFIKFSSSFLYLYVNKKILASPKKLGLKTTFLLVYKILIERGKMTN
ncbi:hypothetical protein IMAU30025_00383 [Lactobacillus helveticus]|nr:hypothetical protein [Lactobacillus helveticus]